ncbi:MAG TPA: glutamate--tRNA ligase family protein, partial [Chloroflexota bacterium]|nr:glutamate--tRNA ligase family protein [Chloroflexota bacterium]
MPATERSVRTRIAPSPTGEPHIGNMYAALFCKAFAVQHNGRFVLRLEDTDRTRFVPAAVQQLPEALHWLGLDPDEGPQQGGPFGPYVQTERLPSYREHAEELV